MTQHHWEDLTDEFKKDSFPKLHNFTIHISGRVVAILQDFGEKKYSVVLIQPEFDYEIDTIAETDTKKDAESIVTSYKEDNPKAGVDGSFWGESAVAQALYNKSRSYIPDRGPANYEGAELIRALERLYYDLHNNGFGNINSKDKEISTVKGHKEKIKSRCIDNSSFSKFESGVEESKRKYDSYDEYVDDILDDSKFVDAFEDVMNAGVILGVEKIPDMKSPTQEAYWICWGRIPEEIREVFGESS